MPNQLAVNIKRFTYSTVVIALFFINSLLLVGCESSESAVEEWPHAAVGMYDASLSDDGRFALVASVNHQAGYWDLQQNKLLFQWRHNDDPESGITVSDISPDGSRALTADKSTFVIWNTTSGKPYGYWQAPADITSAALSDKAKYVLLGLSDGRVVHIDMESGRRLEFTGHRNNRIASVDMSANGVWAFSGAYDGRVVLWNTQSGQPRYVFEHDSRVTLVRLESQGRLAFSSGTRGNAIVWDLESGVERVSLALKPREYVMTAAAFSADGRLLATGAPGRDVRLWSTQNGSLVHQWQVKTRDQWKPSGAIVWAVAFTPDGHIVTEASSGYGQMWRLPSQ
ncbi:WD40 repeat domain-containing protein [Pleionea litopenaei]|uniref:WD-40 repeat-containing protein n=1 Tax=Pleionea litopenaei TaxID=3070815 RepID=A0AA51RRK4_9GAMM|nr:hypothetical protein [Pleionea sp. HL-JVS1]WMS86233.1 hypothetical protein Q9312_13490 [Pleionea sp. HL-JVS1]